MGMKNNKNWPFKGCANALALNLLKTLRGGGKNPLKCL